MNYPFTIEAHDKKSGARAGILKTFHATIETPVFMPVGTLATVKAVTPKQLEEFGFKIILANTYHLFLRPGVKIFEKTGGIHNFMGWKRSILTDSGGFQVFSLKGLTKVTEEGVSFQSHIDGKRIFLSPEEVIRFQETLKSDVMMPLDECPEVYSPKSVMEKSVKRTLRWEIRALKARKNKNLLLFGIIQGGLYKDIRKWHTLELAQHEFDGFSIGGLSVGEKNIEMYELLEYLNTVIPSNAPRYLMGVGTPVDILNAVEQGVDMFDCVLPTRTARNGLLFTSNGTISIKQSRYKTDLTPLDEKCNCYTCTNFTKAYLRHLFVNKEILSSILNTIHNLTFYKKLMEDIRASIFEGDFLGFKKRFLDSYLNQAS